MVREFDLETRMNTGNAPIVRVWMRLRVFIARRTRSYRFQIDVRESGVLRIIWKESYVRCAFFAHRIE